MRAVHGPTPNCVKLGGHMRLLVAIIDCQRSSVLTVFLFPQVSLEDLCTGITKKMKITRQVLNPDGRTTRAEEKLLTIEVKPGWKAGTKVTFAREGDQAANTIPADVVFVIRDKPHPIFTRDGADIKYRAKVSLRDVCITNILFSITL